MAGMDHMEEVKDKEEKLSTPPSDVTDQVEDDASDTAVVVHQNKGEAEEQETETMKAPLAGVETAVAKRTIENKFSAAAGFGLKFGITQHAQGGTESEAGVQEKGSSEKTIRNELELGSSAQAEEDGGRKRERNVTIEVELEYVDNGEKEIELVLDSDKFHRYAPHCHNCDHLATKLILRRKIIDPNPIPKHKYWFVIYFEIFVAFIWRKLNLKEEEEKEEKNHPSTPKADKNNKEGNKVKKQKTIITFDQVHENGKTTIGD